MLGGNGAPHYIDLAPKVFVPPKMKMIPRRRPEETLELIEREQFQDLGCGAVDMSLLASVLLTPDTLLWTTPTQSSPAAYLK